MKTQGKRLYDYCFEGYAIKKAGSKCVMRNTTCFDFGEAQTLKKKLQGSIKRRLQIVKIRVKREILPDYTS